MNLLWNLEGLTVPDAIWNWDNVFNPLCLQKLLIYNIYYFILHIKKMYMYIYFKALFLIKDILHIMNNVKSIPNSLYYFMWINFLLYYTKLKYMWYTRTHAHRYTHKEMRSVINFVQGSSNEYTLILYYSTLKTREKMGNPLWLYTN